jgi:hypothetical protein
MAWPKPVPWQWLYRTQEERPCWRLKSFRLWPYVVWVSSLNNQSTFNFRTMQSMIKTLHSFGISGTACPTTWYHAYIFCSHTMRISKRLRCHVMQFHFLFLPCRLCLKYFTASCNMQLMEQTVVKNTWANNSCSEVCISLTFAFPIINFKRSLLHVTRWILHLLGPASYAKYSVCSYGGSLFHLTICFTSLPSAAKHTGSQRKCCGRCKDTIRTLYFYTVQKAVLSCVPMIRPIPAIPCNSAVWHTADNVSTQLYCQRQAHFHSTYKSMGQ